MHSIVSGPRRRRRRRRSRRRIGIFPSPDPVPGPGVGADGHFPTRVDVILVELVNVEAVHDSLVPLAQVVQDPRVEVLWDQVHAVVGRWHYLFFLLASRDTSAGIRTPRMSPIEPPICAAFFLLLLTTELVALPTYFSFL